MMDLIWLGILLVGLGLVFQIVTLPVEFNASKRALEEIKNNVESDDYKGTKDMLNAAAMTYVASLIVSLMSLIRLILRTNNRRRCFVWCHAL
jgi:Zn-dependent membrane protease YugP